ncbi:hypothetical protein D9M73_163120 [compost metagenome]
MQLHQLGGGRVEQFGGQGQGEVDTGGDPATGQQIAVANHPILQRDCAQRLEQLVIGPVSGGAFALEQSRRTQHQRAGAHRRDVPRVGGLGLEKVQSLVIFHQGTDATATGHADHVQCRAIIEGGGRFQQQAGAGGDRHQVFPDQMHFHIRQRGQYVVRAGQVQLLNLWKQQKTDLQRHGVFSREVGGRFDSRLVGFGAYANIPTNYAKCRKPSMYSLSPTCKYSTSPGRCRFSLRPTT